MKSLTEVPAMRALQRRFDIPDDRLSNYVRCVALSRDANRFVFTAVDEAWCVDCTGKCLWGVKFPAQEGWGRVAARSENIGTSAEVNQALAVMELEFPVTLEMIKNRYRDLARQWHPSRDRCDPHVGDKMKALNVAVEVLTGLDLSTLAGHAGANIVREIGAFQVGGGDVSVSPNMHGSASVAADWISAVGFAATSNAVYLASRSGRFVLVDEYGAAKRVYDTGGLPRRIVDTGDYLYLLCGTRLYVLHDDVLHALVDVFGVGELIIAQTAFGLLEKKCLRWFRKDGQYLGSVLTGDPIRRVYDTRNGMVVETRRQRAEIKGVGTWWEDDVHTASGRLDLTSSS